MNEKYNKNAKVEQLTKMFLSCGEEKCLIVKDPLYVHSNITPYTGNYCIQGKFRPCFIFAHFALCFEGKYKTGPIELHTLRIM